MLIHILKNIPICHWLVKESCVQNLLNWDLDPQRLACHCLAGLLVGIKTDIFSEMCCTPDWLMHGRFFSKYAACWMSCSLCHFYCCRLKLLRSINLSTWRNIKWPAQNMNKLRFFFLDPWHWAKVVSHAGDWEPVVSSDMCNDHLFAAQTLPNEQEIIKIRCHHDMTPGPCKLLTLLTTLILRSSCQNSQRGLIGDIGLSLGPSCPIKC